MMAGNGIIDMIRCPKCNELAFERLTYDQWKCTFCLFTKNNKAKKIELKRGIDA